MKKLSARNADLLRRGCQTIGSFTEGFSYIEESLYVDEVEELWDFCQWIDTVVGGAGQNIRQLFDCWKHPEVAANQAYVAEMQESFRWMASRNHNRMAPDCIRTQE